MPDDPKAQLEELRRVYAEQLPTKLSEVDAAWRALAAGPWSPQKFQEFHRKVHALAGSAGMFGFPAVSEKARILDLELKRLDAAAPPDRETAGRIAGGVSAMAQAGGTP